MNKQIIAGSIESDNNFLCSSNIRVTEKSCVPEDISAIITTSEEVDKQVEEEKSKNRLECNPTKISDWIEKERKNVAWGS